MEFPKYTPGPIFLWIAAAITEFINGVIAGVGGGSVVGIGMGATTAATDLGTGMSAFHQIWLAVASGVLAALGNGIKRIIVWHGSGNPFPNPWAKPSTTEVHKS